MTIYKLIKLMKFINSFIFISFISLAFKSKIGIFYKRFTCFAVF